MGYARNLFRIDEYVTSKMLDNKVVRLRSQFEDDEQINPFIRKAAELVFREARRGYESCEIAEGNVSRWKGPFGVSRKL